MAVLFLASRWISTGSAAVITAVSVEYTDVFNAVKVASDGDTVIVPAGTAVWTQGLSMVNKGITLKGAGHYVYTGGHTLSNATGQETIIIDEVTPRTAALLAVTWTNLTGFVRITGFQFKSGITNTGDNFAGTIRVLGNLNMAGFPHSQWRIDHCFMNKLKGRMGIYAMSGLIDNCYIDQGGQAGIVFDGRIPNPNQKGHWSWATDVPRGTIYEGVYIENSYFTNSVVRGCTDGFTGSRIVFRFNTTHNAAVENHGTESTGIFRGGRWMAIYGNTFNASITAEYATHFRSGSGVIFSNHTTGKFPGLFRGLNYRRRDHFIPYMGANGTNVWDQNDPTVYARGTHTGSNGTTLLSDSASSWTPNQWSGYSLNNMGSGRFDMIATNSSTTIKTHGGIISPTMLWTNGQPYEIRRLIRALDGVGMGKGDLLVGGANSPPTQPTPTTWPNQVDEPIYIWSNTGNTYLSNSGDSTIIEGRNFTNAIHPTYTMLQFPHPLVAQTEEGTGGLGGSEAGAPNRLRVVTPPPL